MSKPNVLILCGGGGSEHEISLVSGKYWYTLLKDNSQFKTLLCLIEKDLTWRIEEKKCELRSCQQLDIGDNQKPLKIDAVLPILHGWPGETGDIQSLLELYQIPYLGCGAEASMVTFNKITTKLWLDALNIPNVPFTIVTDPTQDLEKFHQFFEQHGSLFVKAASQGSAVGSYAVSSKDKLNETIQEAFQFSDYVLLEKTIKGRELEVAVYEHNGKLMVTRPGEIACPSGHYTYEEKYSPNSKTQCYPIAPNLDETLSEQIRAYAMAAFQQLHLRHYSRVDFFVSEQNEIYLNEINTAPGMTPISLFPQMMEATGQPLKTWLEDKTLSLIKSKSST